MRADLHIHTYYSDGLFSIDDVVTAAKTNGLDLISITDHDGMLAYPQVISACKSKGLKCVAGIEISAYDMGEKIHTLGYNVDYTCAAYTEFFKTLVQNSYARAEDIIFKLNRAGVALTMADVEKENTSRLAPIHGMYIARAGAKKQNVHPFVFYGNYLSKGRVAYSEVGRPTPEQAIEVIKASGGFASLAHPGRIELDRSSVTALIQRLVGVGLGGIEAVYSTHTSVETEYYKEVAARYNLVVTGGSDTHFFGGSKNIGTPVFDISDALREKLKFET